MKKTLTANISGTVFHIEEDAYEKLNRYLDSIRLQFTGSTGQEEIMGDIETRVAELLQEHLDGRREVVTVTDVDHVIAVMGQPEDYLVSEDETAGAVPPPGSGGPNWTHAQPRRKRLFRDPDDRWIGGVLGGIGAYFNIDPLILRIIYIVLLIFGVGWLIYLILWIVVPVANTAAEKLEMRGEPVNVENIKRVFDEGAERVRTGAQTFSNEAQEVGRKYGPQAQRGLNDIGSFFSEFFRILFKALGKAVGVLLLMAGTVLAMVLVVLLLGEFTMIGSIDGGEELANFHDLTSLIFGDRSWSTLAWAALIGTILVPVVGLIQGGISLLFNIGTPRWFGYSLTALWIMSIVALTVIGVRVATDFRQREVVETTQELETPSDGILRLTSSASVERHDDALSLINVEGDVVELGWARLDVRQSRDSLFHLVIQRRARGSSYKAANERAHSIRTGWEHRDGTIDLSPWFSFQRGDLYRAQSLRYVLEVPIGGQVHLDARVKQMLDDVHNTSNTWDHDMVDKTWLMTPEGLHREGEKPRLKSTGREEPSEWRITIREEHAGDVKTHTLPSLGVPDLSGVLLPRI